jgi:hypothetical protein
LKKSDLRRTVEIVANVGVIAGIVFLAVELSQNTDAQRSQTVQALQTEFREIFDFSPELLSASFKSPADRTDEERFLRRQFFSRVMRIYENQWYQFERGYLDEELFRGYQQHMRITLASDDLRELWNQRKELAFFHPEFVAYVDSFIAENPPYTTLQIGSSGSDK